MADEKKVSTDEKLAASDKKVPAPKKAGIEVVAVQNGFREMRRLKKGDTFHIPDESHLAKWMLPTDPALKAKVLDAREKERVAKKAALKSKSKAGA